MPDTTSANFLAEVKAQKAAVAAETVTATTVGTVVNAAVAAQKTAVGTTLANNSTTAALAAIGNAINTTGKYKGKLVFNETTGILVVAADATAASVWKNAGTGATAHTPV